MVIAPGWWKRWPTVAAPDLMPAISNVDQLVAEQSDDALQRPHPAQALGRGGGLAPAHRLGPGKGADDRRDGFGEQSAVARPGVSMTANRRRRARELVR